MAASVLSMAMSLDGYMAGPTADLGAAAWATASERLHAGVAHAGRGARPAVRAGRGPVIDAIYATGAVLVGRRTAEIVDHGGGGSTVSRSSSPVTGRPVPRPPTIPW